MHRYLVAALLAALAAVTAGCGGGGGVDGDDDGDLPPDGDATDGDLPPDGDTAAIEPEEGPQTLFVAVADDDFWNFPYPSDLRRTPAGGIAIPDYPNPHAIKQIRLYIEAAGELLDGFSTTPAVWFRFDARLDLATLPSDPAETANWESPVVLVGLDPGAPGYGQPVPVTLDYETRGIDYVPADTLSIQPVYGLPLRQAARYAVVLKRGIRAADGRALVPPLPLKRVLAGAAGPDEAALEPVYRPLLELYAGMDRDPSEIVAATVFTTQTVTSELEMLREFVRDRFSPRLLDWEVEGTYGNYTVIEGHYASPNFQRGAPPYREADDREGEFVFGPDGQPQVQVEEQLRFALTIPPGEAPASGWPVVMYAHGTGGDYRSFIDDDTAMHLAFRKIAAIGIDQPLHGPRAPAGTDVETYSFNYVNPWSGRTCFRQSAVDSMVLEKLLRTGLQFTSGGRTMKLDPARVMFLGHSHGGLTGSLFAALSERTDTYLISGGGGGIALTVLDRADPDIVSVLKMMAGIPDCYDGLPACSGDDVYTVRPGHPALALIQALTDITDPLNYARFFVRQPPAGRPRNMIVTSGDEDPYTPVRTANALAAAAGFPIAEPVAWEVEALGLQGIASIDRPVSGNLDFEGSPATAAFCQYPGWGHYPIFDDAGARATWTRFFESAAYEGGPVIE